MSSSYNMLYMEGLLINNLLLLINTCSTYWLSVMEKILFLEWLKTVYVSSLCKCLFWVFSWIEMPDFSKLILLIDWTFFHCFLLVLSMNGSLWSCDKIFNCAVKKSFKHYTVAWAYSFLLQFCLKLLWHFFATTYHHNLSRC